MIVAEQADRFGQLMGEVSGFGVFHNGPGGSVLYASVDSPGLEDIQVHLTDALQAAGLPVHHDHGYQPHLTLSYKDDSPPVPKKVPEDAATPWPVNEIIVVVGEQWVRYPLSSLATTAAKLRVYPREIMAGDLLEVPFNEIGKQWVSVIGIAQEGNAWAIDYVGDPEIGVGTTRVSANSKQNVKRDHPGRLAAASVQWRPVGEYSAKQAWAWGEEGSANYILVAPDPGSYGWRYGGFVEGHSVAESDLGSSGSAKAAVEKIIRIFMEGRLAVRKTEPLHMEVSYDDEDYPDLDYVLWGTEWADGVDARRVGSKTATVISCENCGSDRIEHYGDEATCMACGHIEKTAVSVAPDDWEEGAAWPEPCDGYVEGDPPMTCARCLWARGAHDRDAGGPTGVGGFGPYKQADWAGFIADEPDPFGLEAELKDSPEPALPETTADDDDDEEDSIYAQGALAHLAPPGHLLGDTGSSMVARSRAANVEIAASASRYLKLGMKAFSPAEQMSLIDEGEGVTAANLDRLDLDGTHYQMQAEMEDDETWML